MPQILLFTLLLLSIIVLLFFPFRKKPKKKTIVVQTQGTEPGNKYLAAEITDAVKETFKPHRMQDVITISGYTPKEKPWSLPLASMIDGYMTRAKKSNKHTHSRKAMYGDK